MKLKSFHVKEFRSINDSNEIEVSHSTCLVGKNEAGKTSLLQALYRLNPLIDSNGLFNVTDDYPRSSVNDYESDIKNNGRLPAEVITAHFELEDSEILTLQELFGRESIDRSKLLKVVKDYENNLSFIYDIDEEKAAKHFVSNKKFTESTQKVLYECKSFQELKDKIVEEEEENDIPKLSKEIEPILSQGLSKFIQSKLLDQLPKFLYFDEYYQMQGCANIQELQKRINSESKLSSDYPLLGLISLANLDLQSLITPNRTRELKNKLEGAGNHLTKTIVKYWSQNKHLKLQFDVREARKDDPEDMRTGNNIWSEIYDTKHQVTTEFGTRSKGFIWFFSFLAWYSDLRKKHPNLILLLDEPGLSLHGKAQGDLLRYFKEEIESNHQLIYTTHSPFMVDPLNFNQVRIVQDLDDDHDDLPIHQQGTKVISDILEATEDSLFPLQGALGYEICQTLFIGPNNLVVEGVSDLLYLQSISLILNSQGKEGLKSDWVITPVGGSDKVPTFVSLIGSQKDLNVAVLIDFQKKDEQTIENLYKKKLLDKKKVITYADFTNTVEADIEDMFDRSFYLKLINEEYKNNINVPIKESDLQFQHPRILVSIEKHLETNPLQGGTFNHYRPARYFTENSTKLQEEISETTLDNFENLFKQLNKLLIN